MRIKFVAFLTVFTTFTVLATGQTPTATLVGRITDASHATVAAATVRVRNTDTNQTRTVESQPNGEFTVANLEPGFYEVTIEKGGFKTTRDSSLELQVGQTA